MRRGIALLLVMAILLCGCQGSQKSAPVEVAIEATNVTVWHYYQGHHKEVFTELIEEFNQNIGKVNNVVVKEVGFASLTEVTAEIIKSAAGEEGALPLPDTLPLYAHTVGDLYRQGLAVNLDDYFTEEELAEYEESYIDNCRVGFGFLARIPTVQTTTMGLLNKTDFEAFLRDSGYSEGFTYNELQTFEGTIRAAEAYYQWTDSLTPDIPHDGKTFFSVNSLDSVSTLAAVQMGAPGSYTKLEDDGSITMAYDEAMLKKLWDIYVVPVVKGYSIIEGGTVDDVQSGGILYLMSSLSNCAYFPNEVVTADGESHEIELSVIAGRYIEDGEKLALISMPDMCVIKTDEAREAGTVSFLKWFADDNQSLRFSLDGTGFIPVKKTALEKMNEEIERVIASTPVQREKNWNLDEYFISSMNAVSETLNAYEMAVFIASPISTNIGILLSTLTEYAEESRVAYLNDLAALNVNGMDEEAIREAAAALGEKYYSNDVFLEWYEWFDASVNEARDEYDASR